MNLVKAKKPTIIADLVNDIPALSRGDLVERWSEYYGNPPTKSISTRLLVFAIAYAVQVERHRHSIASEYRRLGQAE